MSIAEVRALPVVVPLLTAAQALGIGRTTAYAMSRAGEFPVPTHTVGSHVKVNRSDILRALGEPVGVEAHGHGHDSRSER